MLTGTLAPASNKATWIESYGLVDDDTDDPIDISDATEIEIQVCDPKTGCTKLTGTLTGGEIVHVETGVFQWTFSSTLMKTLCTGTYDVGCIITKDAEDVQLLIGQLPVLDGIIR